MDEEIPQLLEDRDQPANDTVPQPEHGHVPTSPAADNNGVAGGDATRPLSTATQRQLPRLPPDARTRSQPEDFERTPSPRRGRNGDAHVRVSPQRQTMGSLIGGPAAPPSASGIDWIVPMNEKTNMRRTVGERLQPTIDHAAVERDKCAKKALFTNYALNIAIGLQVLLGALTTGITAAATTVKQAQISTTLLGGFSTLVAAYLARARGSGEPELSISRVKDLEQFLRESRAFQLDHAHEFPAPENDLDQQLDDFRNRFEELLGNASGEKKLSPVGSTSTGTEPV